MHRTRAKKTNPIWEIVTNIERQQRRKRREPEPHQLTPEELPVTLSLLKRKLKKIRWTVKSDPEQDGIYWFYDYNRKRAPVWIAQRGNVFSLTVNIGGGSSWFNLTYCSLEVFAETEHHAVQINIKTPASTFTFCCPPEWIE